MLPANVVITFMFAVFVTQTRYLLVELEEEPMPISLQEIMQMPEGTIPEPEPGIMRRAGGGKVLVLEYK